MPDPKDAAPFQTMEIGGGASAPFFIVQFDEKGRVENPQTRQLALDTVRAGGFTDLYLFCHGWNNDWKAATSAYRRFIEGYGLLRRSQLPLGRDYRPAMIGVFWPSTALVFPWENSPNMAAGGDDRDAEIAAAEMDVVRGLAARVPEASVGRFYEIAALRRPLTEAEAREFAGWMAPAYAAAGEEVPESAAPATADSLVELWKGIAAAEPAADDDDGRPRPPGAAGRGPAAAGFLGIPSPREILRSFTVWQMKDRAGVVGAHGVRDMLFELLGMNGLRVHLVGHSFGCKVCLAALSAIPNPANPAASVLLLQPAISAKCFATDARGGKPGAYRIALQPTHTRLPILSTFSRHDFPLHTAFHRAVRRKEDLGEIGRAAEVSPFAALGGYGAQGCAPGESLVVDILRPQAAYDLSGAGGVRVISVRGDATISGHGDISNESTYWALHQQVMAS